MLTKSGLLAFVLLAFSGLTTAADAATIHAPAPGTVTAETDGVAFDWAWDSDEYASRIVFTQSPDPNDPIWTGSFARPGVVAYSDQYGPYTSSNAFVRPAGRLSPGDWYWRMCNYSIYGEDDKCSYDAGVAPRLFRVVDVADCSDTIDNDGDRRTDALDGACRAGLPSEVGDPICDNQTDDDADGRVDGLDPGCQKGRADEALDPVCNNRKDDDGDGWTDWPHDDDCESSEGTSEATPPPPPTPPRPEQLTQADAASSARRALRKVFAASLPRGRNPSQVCRRLTRLSFRCTVRWTRPKASYRGSVVIRQPVDARSVREYVLNVRVISKRCATKSRLCARTIRRTGNVR